MAWRDTLIDTYVSWPNVDDKDRLRLRSAGRGEILDISSDGLMLVARIARDYDDEPFCKLMIHVSESGLQFYDTLAEEERWYKYITAKPVETHEDEATKVH